MVQDINHTIYTIKTRSEFSNVSVTAGLNGLRTGAGWAWSTRSQPVASRRLNAGGLTCCYSRRATRQTGLGAKTLVHKNSNTNHARRAYKHCKPYFNKVGWQHFLVNTFRQHQKLTDKTIYNLSVLQARFKECSISMPNRQLARRLPSQKLHFHASAAHAANNSFKQPLFSYPILYNYSSSQLCNTDYQQEMTYGLSNSDISDDLE